MFYEKTKRMVNLLETIFIILFMTVGFLQYCNLTFGHPIISWVQWPAVALGGLLLLYRVCFLKNYLKTPGIFLLIGFIISYIISMAVTFRFGYYENFRGLIFLLFEICLLYAFDRKADKSAAKKKFIICAAYYTAVVGIMTLASIITMLCGVSEAIPQEVGPPYLVIGFIWGRLFGIYWDPNIASAMAAVAVLASLWFFSHCKNTVLRVLNIVNIAVQVIFITLTDSRTGRVALAVAVTVYYAFRIFANGFKNVAGKFKRFAASALCVILVLCITVAVPMAVKFGFNTAVSLIDPEGISIAGDGRDEDVSSDISNRRFDIWGSAVEVWKIKPLTGVSHFNIVPYTEETKPDTYIVNNDYMIFDTMHNSFFDILISQGILGIVTVAAGGIVIAVYMIKRLVRSKDGEDYGFNCMLLGTVAAAVVSAMFMTELVYVITPLTLMFWLSAGALVKNLYDLPEDAR